MDRFYYIPKFDRDNAEKTETMYRYCNEGAPFIGADGVKQHPGSLYGGRILTAYGDIPSVVTVEWCKEFAALTREMTGEEVEHVEVVNGEKKAHYWVKENCLRLCDAMGCFYENNNGVICRDRVAIADGN